MKVNFTRFLLLMAVCFLPLALLAQPGLYQDSVRHEVRFADTLWVNNSNEASLLSRAEFWLKSAHCQNIKKLADGKSVMGEGKTFIGRPLMPPLLIFYTLKASVTDSNVIYSLSNLQLADGNTPNQHSPADTTIIAEERARPYPNPVTAKLEVVGLSFERWIKRKPTASDTTVKSQIANYYTVKSRKNVFLSGFLGALGLAAGSVMLGRIHENDGSPQILAGGSAMSFALAIMTGAKAYEYRKMAKIEDAYEGGK